MNKAQLKAEIQNYITIGYSIDNACMQINNLYLNKYLNTVYTIQKELSEAA